MEAPVRQVMPQCVVTVSTHQLDVITFFMLLLYTF